jgi:hypothetical protein
MIDNAICNCCGKPIHKVKDICGRDMFIDYIRFINNNIMKPCYPEFFEDFYICEDCAKKINSSFKIPVEKVDI